MELKDFGNLGIVTAIAVICVSIFIGELNITNTQISAFISKSQALSDQAKQVRSTFEAKTSEKSISDLVEQIPILGTVIKAGKYLATIVGTLRSAIDVFIGFFQDMLTSEVIGIDARIVGLIIVALFISFTWAIWNAMRGAK